jgi:hypothetical protein
MIAVFILFPPEGFVVGAESIHKMPTPQRDFSAVYKISLLMILFRYYSEMKTLSFGTRQKSEQK